MLHMDSQEIQSQQPAAVDPMEQAMIAAKYGLNKWIFRRGQSFVTGRILEIGEGEGHVAKYCRREGAPVEVQPVNLEDEAFSKTYAVLSGAFDLVYLFQDSSRLVSNKSIVTNSASLLKEGGHLITILPCATALYQGLGQGLDDWKSYNRHYVRSKLDMIYELVRTRYFEILDNLPSLVPPDNDYDERVKLFEKTADNDLAPTGLFILIVAKKL